MKDLSVLFRIYGMKDYSVSEYMGERLIIFRIYEMKDLTGLFRTYRIKDYSCLVSFRVRIKWIERLMCFEFGSIKFSGKKDGWCVRDQSCFGSVFFFN